MPHTAMRTNGLSKQQLSTMMMILCISNTRCEHKNIYHNN